ncbi:hypothetical protein [Micromonospora sp. WMMD1082]|uniref:hypothetical protein n=1 Tax=Micromonospora sp. WMMD1082 TaxID=3016104 RepID=UPI002415BAA9|nr:hypothetical protein [Micromonospora sp. WMMD1082]MDG4793228.1 hypothetical protein [Micromonospora sp. WMMD1082]
MTNANTSVRPASPPASLPPAASNATRHLCAGAYLDEQFQRTSLNEVYHQEGRLVAPSYGFDLVAVLGHCLQARRLVTIRDAVILGVLVVSACAAPLAFGFALTALVTLYLITSTVRLIQDTVRELRQGSRASAGLIVGRTALVLLRFLIAGVLLLLLGPIVFAASLGTVAAMQSGGRDPSLAAFSLHPSVMLMVLLLVLAPPVVANLVRQSRLDTFAPGRMPTPPARSHRFDDIRRQETGNTIVYSGYRPFVGAGYLWKSWGLAQRLVRAGSPLKGLAPEGEREFASAPFTAAELVGHLRDELTTLTTEQAPERRLPGLTVDDRVFLAGTKTAQLIPYTPPEHVAEILRNPTAPARHYLVCQVVSWRGELVTTVHVHVAVQGKSLYIEFTSTALPPCDDRYRVVDQVGGTGREAYLRATVRGLLDAPTTIGQAPINLIRAGVNAVLNSNWTKADRQVRAGYDYGATVSVRELGTAPDTRNHIQTQEIDKYQRIIERRLLAAVLDFLDGRGVDTTEYRQRALTVLNAGAVVTNGSLTVHGDVNATQTLSAAVNPGGDR